MTARIDFATNAVAEPVESAVLIVEAAAGRSRSDRLGRILQAAVASGGRAFLLSCDFDKKGPWSAVSDLFLALLPEMLADPGNLVEQHAAELVSILPHLARELTLPFRSLTDLAQRHEKTRNYPADRALRNVHGLIDLLDSWKSERYPNESWIIAGDSFDNAGTICATFFQQLMRRRGKALNITFLAGVAPGNGGDVRKAFPADVRVETADSETGFQITTELQTERAEDAEKLAAELEANIGEDHLALTVHLSELIRLWRLARRDDRLLGYRLFALETYNSVGLYADAKRYGDGLLELAATHAPADPLEAEELRWRIVLGLIFAHMALGEVEASARFADEEGRKLAENRPDWGVDLMFLRAMLYGRYQKPRDYARAEECLKQGCDLIERSRLSPEDRLFKTVFNMNGLAMLRNFQRRHEEAIQLCRAGAEILNAHLGADRHRLHKSVLVYNIAQVYQATGCYEEAIENYSVALDMDPNYSEYHNERANVLLGLGRLEEAKADYLKAIQLSPPYFEVWTNLGQCYRRLGAMLDAAAAYSRSLDLRPDQTLALLGRAKAHEELGQTEAAIEDYSAAIARDPSQWEAVASRGVLHYEAGRLDASLSDLNRAVELQPGDSALHQNRATVLAALARYRDAREDLLFALTLNQAEEDRSAIRATLEGLAQTAELAFSA